MGLHRIVWAATQLNGTATPSVLSQLKILFYQIMHISLVISQRITQMNYSLKKKIKWMRWRKKKHHSQNMTK